VRQLRIIRKISSRGVHKPSEKLLFLENIKQTFSETVLLGKKRKNFNVVVTVDISSKQWCKVSRASLQIWSIENDKNQFEITKK